MKRSVTGRFGTVHNCCATQLFGTWQKHTFPNILNDGSAQCRQSIMDHHHKAGLSGFSHQQGCAHVDSRKSTFRSLYGHDLANSRQLLQALANKTITLCGDSLQDQLFDALKCSFSEVASTLTEYPTKYLSNFDIAKRTFNTDENPKQPLNGQVPEANTETRVRLRSFGVPMFGVRVQLLRHYKIRFPSSLVMPSSYLPGKQRSRQTHVRIVVIHAISRLFNDWQVFEMVLVMSHSLF